MITHRLQITIKFTLHTLLEGSDFIMFWTVLPLYVFELFDSCWPALKHSNLNNDFKVKFSKTNH